MKGENLDQRQFERGESVMQRKQLRPPLHLRPKRGKELVNLVNPVPQTQMTAFQVYDIL
jgi:hypothetical protein